MVAKAEIELAHEAEHDRITYEYYKAKTLSKADFDAQHGALVAATEKLLVDNGYYTRPPIPTDWAALYMAAESGSERIRIIAQRLGLMPQDTK